MNEFTEKPANAPVQRAANGNIVRGPAFLIRDLAICYHGKPALRIESLDIHPGRITSLIGPSGCGKTSLLNCLNRLTDTIAHCSVNGQLHHNGTSIYDPQLNVTSHRRRVGAIFQKPNPFPLSILKNFELPLREHGVRRRAQQRRIAEEKLLQVGLWEEVKDRLHSSALELSGGQQQRLCIARALSLSPEVLLMDEPCSALDPLSSGVVEDLIVSLRGRLTIVVVTHNLAQARRIADDVAVFWLRDGCGRLIEANNADRVFQNPTDPLTAAYIGGARG